MNILTRRRKTYVTMYKNNEQERNEKRINKMENKGEKDDYQKENRIKSGKDNK